MNVDEFRRQIEAQEIHIVCTFCDATMWVEHRDGQPHLMRLSETHVDNCPICTEIHELIE